MDPTIDYKAQPQQVLVGNPVRPGCRVPEDSLGTGMGPGTSGDRDPSPQGVVESRVSRDKPPDRRGCDRLGGTLTEDRGS